jgi:hypothetical protein
MQNTNNKINKKEEKFNFDREWRNLMKSIKDLRDSQKETDEQMKRTDEQMKRTDEQMKRTDEQMKRNEEKLARMGISFGNLQNNLGEEKEEMFYQYLDKTKKLGNIKFDEVRRNLSDGTREYDIVMRNGKYIAIIEVKQKAHPKDVDRLITEQVSSFKENFSLGQNKKVVLALATPTITDKVKKEAEKKGVMLLGQNGNNVMEEQIPLMKTY